MEAGQAVPCLRLLHSLADRSKPRLRLSAAAWAAWGRGKASPSLLEPAWAWAGKAAVLPALLEAVCLRVPLPHWLRAVSAVPSGLATAAVPPQATAAMGMAQAVVAAAMAVQAAAHPLAQGRPAGEAAWAGLLAVQAAWACRLASAGTATCRVVLLPAACEAIAQAQARRGSGSRGPLRLPPLQLRRVRACVWVLPLQAAAAGMVMALQAQARALGCFEPTAPPVSAATAVEAALQAQGQGQGWRARVDRRPSTAVRLAARAMLVQAWQEPQAQAA